MGLREIKREIPKVWEKGRAHTVFQTLQYICSGWKLVVGRE